MAFEDDERFPRLYLHVELERERSDDPCDVEAGLKVAARERIVIEADVGDVFEVESPELLEQPRLADLPGAVENERFAARAVLPCDQLFHEGSFHMTPS